MMGSDLSVFSLCVCVGGGGGGGRVGGCDNSRSSVSDSPR